MRTKVLAWMLILAMVLTMGTVCAFASGDEAEETEQTEQVEETEEAEEEEELSDDIYSFQLEMDGELYTFPMSFADFTAMGWEYQGDAEEQMGPNQYTVGERFQKGDAEVYASLVNLGINTVTFAEASVGGMSMDPYQFEDAPDTQIVFPGGIVFGQATAEDIEAAYGKPSDVYEGDMYTKMNYEYDSYQEWDFYVYAESGVLEEFEVRNFVEDEEANAAAAAQVSDEPTEEVLAYEAPEELGDELMSFKVEYAGVVYQLPVPVRVMEEDGWTVKEELSEPLVSGGSFGWVTMMKDNQELRCMATNYGPDAAVIRNCFVTSFKADTLGPDLPLTLPGGATLGMTEDELLAFLDDAGVEYEKDESSGFLYYEVKGPENILDGFEFILNKEEGNVVTGIEVTYEPDALD